MADDVATSYIMVVMNFKHKEDKYEFHKTSILL